MGASDKLKDNVAMYWEAIPMAAKFTVMAVTAAVTSVLWMFSTFVTKVENDRQWQDHIQSNQCAKVSEYRLTIERARWDLDNLELPDKASEARIRDINSLYREIDRLDPSGRCS